MSILIGIDLGTTNIKICAFNNQGDLLFKSSLATVVERSKSGDTLNADRLWESVLDLLEKTTAAINPKEVNGIGVTSMAETVFPVNQAGSVLAGGIIWYDQCSRQEYETILRAVSPETIRKITGLRPSWLFSASKILYYRNYLPDIYGQTEMFLDVSGFIAFKLTGRKYMDLSHASRSMLLDLDQGSWSQHLVESFGIEPDKLPILIPCGFGWGEVLPEIGRKLKLDSKTVVTTAGQDHIAAAYAAGVAGNDKLLDSIGTSEALLSGAELKTIQSDTFQEERLFSAGYHALKDVFYLLDGLPTGGYCIDWLLKRVLMTGYSLLDNIKWRESSIMFFPYLRNTMQGPASARIENLTDRDDRDSLVQGIIEGIAFEFKRYVERLHSIRGHPDTLKEIIAVGGGTRNKLLMLIKSEVMDMSIKVLEHADVAANLGAAMMSGTAAGIFKEEWDCNSMRKYLKIYHPEDRKHISFYQGKYQEYLECFPN